MIPVLKQAKNDFSAWGDAASICQWNVLINDMYQ